MAIERVFGEHALSHRLKISGTKSMTGHLLGGASGLNRHHGAGARQPAAPPTINLDNPDPECRLLRATGYRHKFDIGCRIRSDFGGITPR